LGVSTEANHNEENNMAQDKSHQRKVAERRATVKTQEAIAAIREVFENAAEAPRSEQRVFPLAGATEKQIAKAVRRLAEADHENEEEVFEAVDKARTVLGGDIWGFYLDLRKEVLLYNAVQLQVATEPGWAGMPEWKRKLLTERRMNEALGGPFKTFNPANTYTATA
jgi:type II secretory pathway component PulC